MLAQKLLEAAGNATQPAYIEDVFSTYLYTGNGSTQTITNGIDLAGKGGMVWMKNRTTAYDNAVVDSARGLTNGNILITNLTNAAQTGYPANQAGISAFNSNGFTLRADGGGQGTNYAVGDNLVSWTFRKQPKFFDVVTGTGKGTFTHNLGVVPGCIILKRTSTTGNWIVAHNGLTGGITGTYVCLLNTTDAQSDQGVSLSPTATTFNPSDYVGNSDTWVAYFFASNAGGFGLTGTDNVISCGSYTGNGSATGPIVTLGYEPQWVMVKNTGASLGDWNMADNLRGMAVNDTTTFNTQRLRANLSSAEGQSGWISPTATGFQIIGGNASNSNYNASGETYIYIAIRRGPMKVPTDATKVFKPQSVTESTSGAFTNTMTSNFVVDMGLEKFRTGTSNWPTTTRLTGTALYTNLTLSEQTSSTSYNTQWGSNTQLTMDAPAGTTGTTIMYAFQRAPSFFDEVCYTGTGSATTFTHNLGVAPELMIVKRRNTSGSSWIVYSSGIAVSNILLLNNTAASATNTGAFNSTAPTSSVFTVGTSPTTNESASTFVAYLFASCPGVSKCGSYTGNGSTQTINCGFTGGARFVLIKRTDSTGDWYVWDTARGIVSGNDPHLSLNTTAAEVTTDDTIDPDNTGFIVNQLSATNVNVSSATYIYLAIA